MHELAAAHGLAEGGRGTAHAVDPDGWRLYEEFSALVDGRAPMEPRDLLELVPAGSPVPLEEVEPVESILARFSGGAMSHGALSAEAHETIADRAEPARRQGQLAVREARIRPASETSGTAASSRSPRAASA